MFFPHTSKIILFPIYTFDPKKFCQRLKILENIDVVNNSSMFANYRDRKNNHKEFCFVFNSHI